MSQAPADKTPNSTTDLRKVGNELIDNILTNILTAGAQLKVWLPIDKPTSSAADHSNATSTNHVSKFSLLKYILPEPTLVCVRHENKIIEEIGFARRSRACEVKIC